MIVTGMFLSAFAQIWSEATIGNLLAGAFVISCTSGSLMIAKKLARTRRALSFTTKHITLLISFNFPLFCGEV